MAELHIFGGVGRKLDEGTVTQARSLAAQLAMENNPQPAASNAAASSIRAPIPAYMDQMVSNVENDSLAGVYDGLCHDAMLQQSQVALDRIGDVRALAYLYLEKVGDSEFLEEVRDRLDKIVKNCSTILKELDVQKHSISTFAHGHHMLVGFLNEAWIKASNIEKSLHDLKATNTMLFQRISVDIQQEQDANLCVKSDSDDFDEEKMFKGSKAEAKKKVAAVATQKKEATGKANARKKVVVPKVVMKKDKADEVMKAKVLKAFLKKNEAEKDRPSEAATSSGSVAPAAPPGSAAPPAAVKSRKPTGVKKKKPPKKRALPKKKGSSSSPILCGTSSGGSSHEGDTDDLLGSDAEELMKKPAGAAAPDSDLD
jgi:hypothetical protein